jgi:hypothetical protein
MPLLPATMLSSTRTAASARSAPPVAGAVLSAMVTKEKTAGPTTPEKATPPPRSVARLPAISVASIRTSLPIWLACRPPPAAARLSRRTERRITLWSSSSSKPPP